MCGIVAMIAPFDVAPFILRSLQCLEYRGYDSAGIATISLGKMHRFRVQGKLVNLERCLNASSLSGTIGLGHTRWATHGPANEENAHPHFSRGVAVVHNGIIENFRVLKESLLLDGYVFHSSTDTEVVAHLVARELERGSTPVEAAFRVFAQLKGAFSLALMFEQDEDLIVGIRNGPPLVVGFEKDTVFLASDAVAFSWHAGGGFTCLEDGDRVVLRRNGISIMDENGSVVARRQYRPSSVHLPVDKGDYRHFMAKEIHEQPEVVSHALARYIDFSDNRIRSPLLPFDFASLERLFISGCGTAYLSGMIAKHWFEEYAGLPVDLDLASEFRYRTPLLSSKTAAIFVSQSGETADTLASLRACRKADIPVVALVNAEESSMAREADAFLPVLAGPEIGVASTKAFTCQLSVMAALAVAGAKARGHLSTQGEEVFVRQFSEIPALICEALKLESRIQHVAVELARYKHAFYLGRGVYYPLALEGALKLKEISYIHAEGYAAGELKHGPMALVDENIPVIFIAPFNSLFDKTLSSMQEVAARGGRIILLTDKKGAGHCPIENVETVVLPCAPEIVTPILYAVPIQMLAYFTAVLIGTDIDQPRNLAKSVTVE